MSQNNSVALRRRQHNLLQASTMPETWIHIADCSGKVCRDMLGSFLTRVVVLSTRAQNGQARALTVNSFTSVSLDPALVLACNLVDPNDSAGPGMPRVQHLPHLDPVGVIALRCTIPSDHTGAAA